MRWLPILCLATLGAPAAAGDGDAPALKGWTGPKPPKPPCECRSRAGKTPLGGVVCVERGGRMVTLRCVLVLNNTSWEEIAEGCAPTS